MCESRAQTEAALLIAVRPPSAGEPGAGASDEAKRRCDRVAQRLHDRARGSARTHGTRQIRRSTDHARAQSCRSSAYKIMRIVFESRLTVSPPRSAGPRVARTGHAHSPGTPLPRARHPTAFHIRRQRHLGCCRAPQSTSHLFKHTTVPTPHRPDQNCIIVTFSLASLMLTLTSLGLDGLSSGGGGGGGLVLPSTPAASAPGTRQERTPPLASAVQRSFS